MISNKFNLKNFYGIVIFTFSILIITFIGFIDTKNHFETYKLEEFNILINIEKLKIENSLNDGYRLKTFIGYKRLFERILNFDKSIINVTVCDENSKEIFSSSDVPQNLKKTNSFTINSKINLENGTKKGYITTTINSYMFYNDLYRVFYKLLFAYCLIVVFIILYTYNREKKHKKHSYLKLLVLGQIFYIAVLLSLTNILVINSLENRNKTLISNIAEQINFAKAIGIPINKISQIDTTFKEYIKEYKSLAWINIKKDTHFLYDIKKPNINTIKYSLKLANKELSIHFSTPAYLIYKEVLNNIKDFIFLLFASTIISYYLYTILLGNSNILTRKERWEKELLIIKPLVFFVFLAETLNISFLPEYFGQIAILNSIDKSQIKYLFSIYFLFFVLSFFPATYLVKRYGTKIVYLLSVFFVFFGSILLFSSQNYYIIMIARAFSGISLGFVLIATENHLIRILPVEKRKLISATTGVLYSAAIICGSILGSLLSTYLATKFIFFAEFILTIFIVLYISIFIKTQYAAKIEKSILSFKEKLKLLQDWNFIKTVILTGFFSKITLSGVVVFALPLILYKLHFAKSQVGQIIVFYSVGILIGGFVVSKLKTIKTTEKPLIIGLILSAISMICMGGLNIFDNNYIMTIILLVSLCLLGFSHSIISSYLLPYIFHFDITKRLGITQVRPFILTCERGGNIFGPLIMMELLLLFHFTFISILVLGFIAMLFVLIQKFF